MDTRKENRHLSKNVYLNRQVPRLIQVLLFLYGSFIEVLNIYIFHYKKIKPVPMLKLKPTHKLFSEPRARKKELKY